MDGNQAWALASPISSQLQKSFAAFRTFAGDDELEEFRAFYDEAEQREVIAKAHAAVTALGTGWLQVKGEPEAAKVFLREVTMHARRLAGTLAVADPSFSAKTVEDLLASVALPSSGRQVAAAEAEQAKSRRGQSAVPKAGTVEAVTAVLGPLARTPAEKKLLVAIAAKALEVKKKTGGAFEIVFAETVVTCAKPGKPAKSVPASYAALAKRHASVLWKRAGTSVGFLGVSPSGALANGTWESDALEEGDNAKFRAALAKAKRKASDVRGAFACGQNWVVFDPTRAAKSGEPALSFVSHGDCKLVPMKSADGHDASGVLLRFLAWSVAGHPAYREISA